MLRPQKFDLSSLPDDAMVGIDAIVAIGPYGRSKFYAEMAAGRAPRPALKAQRCTRWRLGDVLQWVRALTAEGGE